jgi:mediator of RNA polymerase II transcription subunit 5
MVDTDALLQFLHNRYQGDTQTACIDLIISSFDIVANATFRNEPPATTFILRSFLTNKVPLLLVQMSTSLLGVANPEDIISQALSQVDTAALPSMSSMFDSDVGDVFGDSPKGEFCFACCLHGLLPEEATQRLLGEIVTMMSLPAGGLYKKEDLVQQCLNDPEKVETFAGELERMDGNVGAVSEALVAVIAQLADNRDTMTLKSLCSLIAKRPDSMSALLMFNRPVVILHPLVRLLDSWRYDDDQNEYQPVYEEFGSILLLILAFVGRFNLSPSDLSITTSSSFVSRLLSSGPQKRVLSTLSQQENEQIGGWISALFNAEGGGLSDETMARCPPQDFYMLVPCLFEQICAAVSQGYLTEDVLRGGLEYLVETFLLPALVPALKYLSAQLLSGGSEAATIIRVLNFLVTPASISSEARGMLDAVLHITARPLESSLRHLQVMEPRRQDVEPLSTTVRQYLAFPRTGAAEATEIENWTRGEHGGLEPTLRKAVQSLIAWAGTIAQTGGNANGQSPPSYTHRLVWFACRIWGAKYVMSILAEEAAEATKNGSGSVAIDAVAAMVCAPSPSGPTPLATPPRVAESQPAETTSRRTLRDALKADAERAGKIHKADPPLAETIVQLYRRVEALLAQPHPIHDPSVDMATVDMGTADMQAQMDISLSEPTQTLQTQQSASGNEMSLDHHSVNLDGMDLSMSSNPLGTQGSMDTAMAGLGGSADDLMAGMDTGELMSFDDLDEEMMRDF